MNSYYYSALETVVICAIIYGVFGTYDNWKNIVAWVLVSIYVYLPFGVGPKIGRRQVLRNRTGTTCNGSNGRYTKGIKHLHKTDWRAARK